MCLFARSVPFAGFQSCESGNPLVVCICTSITMYKSSYGGCAFAEYMHVAGRVMHVYIVEYVLLSQQSLFFSMHTLHNACCSWNMHGNTLYHALVLFSYRRSPGLHDNGFLYHSIYAIGKI